MWRIALASTTLTLAALAAPDEDKKPDVATVGEAAPAFELTDQSGNKHSLAKYKGRIVVLEWFNEQCPYCMGVWKSGLVQETIKDLKEVDEDIVWLAINSTANRPKEAVLETGKKFLEDLEAKVPMLMDYDGTVGHVYAAKTTPHVYVIDAEGVLRYQGAISDDSRMREGEKAQTHVLRVVKQITADEKVSPEYVKPWGCSVKYARSRRGGGGGRGRAGRLDSGP